MNAYVKDLRQKVAPLLDDSFDRHTCLAASDYFEYVIRQLAEAKRALRMLATRCPIADESLKKIEVIARKARAENRDAE